MNKRDISLLREKRLYLFLVVLFFVSLSLILFVIFSMRFKFFIHHLDVFFAALGMFFNALGIISLIKTLTTDDVTQRKRGAKITILSMLWGSVCFLSYLMIHF